ncbi:hypothetical protein [Streptomyces coeruleorubidus]|uniref:Uncharacterized protein n=1 Tax=Streptomyces coeruleorubidus TaxID=116188 RepID=A0ABZ0KQF6_STRC4|nr:hypothetical protein [Streptomyces coeruleorubidus]WOT40136.1 hypothetical protein R5U08_41185 [Streptomyces coeruleorubidus]
MAWSGATASDLRVRFVDRPDESSDTFLVKLRRQLDGAPDATVVLAAELLFVNMAPLVPEQIGLAKKRQILGEVLSWADRPVAVPADLEPGLKGFLHGGQGFLNYRWAQFQILVLLVERLAALPEAERQALLDDPWRFREECLDVQRSVGHKKGRAQIHVLLYLLFPETYQPIASAYHKQEIVKAFADELPEPTGDDDRDLLELCRTLEEQTGQAVDFYDEPWVGRWRGGAVEHEQRGWLVRGYNVDGRNLIPDWLRRGYCSMAWREIPEIPAAPANRTCSGPSPRRCRSRAPSCAGRPRTSCTPFSPSCSRATWSSPSPQTRCTSAPSRARPRTTPRRARTTPGAGRCAGPPPSGRSSVRSCPSVCRPGCPCRRRSTTSAASRPNSPSGRGWRTWSPRSSSTSTSPRRWNCRRSPRSWPRGC